MVLGAPRWLMGARRGSAGMPCVVMGGAPGGQIASRGCGSAGGGHRRAWLLGRRMRQDGPKRAEDCSCERREKTAAWRVRVAVGAAMGGRHTVAQLQVGGEAMCSSALDGLHRSLLHYTRRAMQPCIVASS